MELSFTGLRNRLARGERGVCQLLAVDRDQAKVCLNYTRAFFEQPILAQMVKRETAEGIELRNNINIEITTADRRRVRGRTVIFCVLDELGHWRSEGQSVNPAEDVYQSIRPAMATIPNSLLIGISSPHARTGLLWRKYQELWGQPDGSAIFIKAPTWRMNPTLARDGDVISGAFKRDPAWADAEFGANFRTDIEAFVSIEALEAVTSPGVFERAPQPNTAYFAFVDPSGGSADSMSMAISHWDGEKAVLDLAREVVPPFSPEGVVEEFCSTLAPYRVFTVRGDKYAGLWPREQFAKRGVGYLTSDKPKSDIYRDLLPAINSGSVDLLDNDRLAAQFVSLERRNIRGGRAVIDHPDGPGFHDDLANAVAGALCLAVGPEQTVSIVGPILMQNGEPVSNTFGLSWLNSKPKRVDLADEFPMATERRPG